MATPLPLYKVIKLFWFFFLYPSPCSALLIELRPYVNKKPPLPFSKANTTLICEVFSAFRCPLWLTNKSGQLLNVTAEEETGPCCKPTSNSIHKHFL